MPQLLIGKFYLCCFCVLVRLKFNTYYFFIFTDTTGVISYSFLLKFTGNIPSLYLLYVSLGAALFSKFWFIFYISFTEVIRMILCFVCSIWLRSIKLLHDTVIVSGSFFEYFRFVPQYRVNYFLFHVTLRWWFIPSSVLLIS